MLVISERTDMAKKTSKPAARLTVLNIKGSLKEKEYIQALSLETGVSISEITRRSIAAWAVKRGAKKAPSDWVVE